MPVQLQTRQTRKIDLAAGLPGFREFFFLPSLHPGTPIKRVAYYISSHGYGHAVRSTVIIAKILETAQVFIKSAIPADFFHLYLKGNFILEGEEVDAGCIQKDFIHIDADKTFQKLETFLRRSEERLQSEIRWLKEKKIDLILSDAASAPLAAGHALDIPTFLVANFTWHDIYSHLPGVEHRMELLDALRNEYSRASLQLLPQCHIENDLVRKKREVGFIARKGRNLRDELEHALNTSFRNKTLIFIYLGEAGADSLKWQHLKKLEHCVFLTRDPLPRNVPNLYVLDERFRYPDLIASSDIVCTKAGYSTLATAFAHDKPVISCARKNFREFEVMKDYLNRRGVGRIIEPDRFYSCDWDEDIKKAREITVKGKVRLDGEMDAVKIIDNFPRPGSLG
ncbi:MAG: hypothetical protein ACE5E9_05105 [Nitrospinaceae bacterium]